MNIPSPSSGPKQRMRFWPAWRVMPSAHTPLNAADLSHESIGQETRYLQSYSERCKARLDVLPLRIRLVSADLRIPIRRRIGEELTLPAEGAHRLFIDFDAQARPFRNGDVTLNHEVPFIR